MAVLYGNLEHYLQYFVVEAELAEAKETACMSKEDKRSRGTQGLWTLIMAPICKKFVKQCKRARESRESRAPYRRAFREERRKLVNKHWGTRSAKYLAAAKDCDTEIEATEIDSDSSLECIVVVPHTACQQ